MYRLTPEMKMSFKEYVADAVHAGGNLEFLMDNLSETFEADCSLASLEAAERAYWEYRGAGIPADLSSPEQFAHLLGQYLGECIRHRTGARWIQCEDRNPMFGQPCIEGFGGDSSDRIYPVQLATQIDNLQPSYPGAAERRAFAATLERAIHACREQGTKE